ncbi:GNAT family N-acetyltransferase [Nocardioides euryhalodurans]|uniref:N-acetyltransferase n=1 Tax=Nocardioides euryhalodurans TaxID=2518370 RepID=A0A4V1BE70_9ACTN|nr:GNAT family N-acetyltransferase [Nocardioides euryhalodurans]QBR93592.1 N-acetyltransferase [Nocardioides euryhalodurans]
MRAVGVEELRDLPFVRHQVDPGLLVGAWQGADGAALVLAGRHLDEGPRLVATALGAPEPLAPLLAYAAASQPLPARLLIAAGSEAAVPAAWSWSPGRRWHWMLTRAQPQPSDPRVVEVDDPDEITALLDREAPGSFARPGTPGIEAWLGVRVAGRLDAVGAVLRQPDGTGHLRGVTVAATARGRGLGRLVSTALTARALAGPGVASLGVYVDNAPALRIYRGLGYEVAHTLIGGPLSGSSITTAVVPSR